MWTHHVTRTLSAILIFLVVYLTFALVFGQSIVEAIVPAIITTLAFGAGIYFFGNGSRQPAIAKKASRNDNRSKGNNRPNSN